MKVLRVNDITKACQQSELSDVELDVDVLVGDKEYTLILEGRSTVNVLEDSGDYFTPSSVDQEVNIELLESYIYKDGDLVPMFNTVFTFSMLETLLSQYTS